MHLADSLGIGMAKSDELLGHRAQPRTWPPLAELVNFAVNLTRSTWRWTALRAAHRCSVASVKFAGSLVSTGTQ
jgi:hypothetical protein